MNGGYDEGYQECPCFWGTEPGSLVRLIEEHVADFTGLRVLDAGCGEGKNAVYLAHRGAQVDAFDVSELAIQNGRNRWSDVTGIRWLRDDIRRVELPREQYAIVVAYGLLHCMNDGAEIRELVRRLQNATCPSGYMIVCAFNDRHQELEAHPGFSPCLLTHAGYVSFFSEFEIIAASDSDLVERHPHNKIEHSHSMTRILARKEPK